MFNVSVTLNYSIPAQDIETLVEMAGYGIKYWAVDAEDTGTSFIVWYEDVEGDPSTIQKRTATYEELAHKLADFAANGHGYVSEYARAYFRDMDAGEIDGELADVIVQLAIFGEVIYG